MNDVCLSNDVDCELIIYLLKKYHMSNFEEKAHLGGFDNSEDYLNYLSNEDSDVTLHKEEDVEENDEILFVVNKNSIYEKAKSLLNIFYSSYDNKDCSWNECEYRYTYLNDVLFIETCEDEFIEALFSLDNNERALFDDFKIEIEIDSYYSRAEIKAFLKDDFFIM